MALQGTLDTFALPDVLRLLAATKKTGRLRLSGGRGTGSVWVDDGGISGIEVPHAPHATDAVDRLFELLRFEEGSFTFEADVTVEEASGPDDVEILLTGAEAILAEWREIESVVPSMDAWVTLRRTLASSEVSIDAAHWTTVVAVGGGATVRRMSEDLCLAELPVSRAVRDLVALGLADVELAMPANLSQPTTSPAPAEPQADAEVTSSDAIAAETDRLDAPEGDVPSPGSDAPEPDVRATGGVSHDAAPLPTARPLRARRARGLGYAETSNDPDVFVPLALPGHGPAGSYDPIEELDDDGDDQVDEAGQVEEAGQVDEVDELDELEGAEGEHSATGDLAAAFPGLANRSADPTPEDEELARQMSTLSPRAAEAVRAAAEATTDEERDAALDEAEEGEERPINRGLLLKFLSSVKS